MTDVGDVVVNCLDGEIMGVSEVATLAKETARRPPLPAKWEYATSFFRFELRNFRRFSESARLRDVASKYFNALRDDITLNSPKYYLYSYHRPGVFAPDGKIVLSQGRFLARGTPTLAMCLASVISPQDASVFKQRITPYLDQQHDLQPQLSGVKAKTA